MTDQQLLRDYAEDGSETAFTELVRRHTDMVYSVALRTVCNAHQAEEVAQAVFMALAQSARRLAKREVLSGWLYATAHYLAVKAVRSEARRRAREQESVAMKDLSDDADVAWQDLAPHFDKAVSELSESDRDALAMRYFERKSAREIAQILGISDQAAQKRINRAVERLRALFNRRGLAIGASGLVVLISANAVEAAPPGLADAISAATPFAGAPLAAATTATAAKAVAMTSVQKSLVTAALALLATAGIYKASDTSPLPRQVHSLRDPQAIASRAEQQPRIERDATTASVSASKQDTNSLQQRITDLPKSRAEIAHASAGSEELARLTRSLGQTNAPEAQLKELQALVNELQQQQAQGPGERIPALSLLPQKDSSPVFAGEPDDAQLDTDELLRQALLLMRNVATNDFLGDEDDTTPQK